MEHRRLLLTVWCSEWIVWLCQDLKMAPLPRYLPDQERRHGGQRPREGSDAGKRPASHSVSGLDLARLLDD